MPTISVDGSAARLLEQGTTEAAGRCLEHVWIAIGQGNHYLTSGGESAAATAAAVPAVNRNYDIDNIPAGYPIFLDRDVFISEGIVNGSGTAIATDWPRNTQIGRCTVAQRMHQTGENFQFWATSMGGYDLTSTSTASAGTPTPISAPQDEENKMTDMIYYADTAQGPASAAIPTGPNKGLIVAQESSWYAECPGAPLFPLSGNVSYAVTAALSEYEAFSAGKPNDMSKRLAVPAQAIADLIALRGTTAKPIGNFTTTAGATGDPAAWGKAAAAAFTAALPTNIRYQ